jgi:hypothetical protein
VTVKAKVDGLMILSATTSAPLDSAAALTLSASSRPPIAEPPSRFGGLGP